MTEIEWGTSSDHAAMLEFLTESSRSGPIPFPCATPRKLRLFACACCRQVWHLLTDARSRRAVEVAELYADGLETAHDLDDAWRASCQAIQDAPTLNGFAVHLAGACSQRHPVQAMHDLTLFNPMQSAILRTMVNPFRPLRLPRPIINSPHYMSVAALESGATEEEIPCPWLTWNNGTVLKLAQAAYEQRLEEQCGACGGDGCKRYTRQDEPGPGPRIRVPCDYCPTKPNGIFGTGRISTGILDPDRLAILSDALEDAMDASGMRDEGMLRVLRGQMRCGVCVGTGGDLTNYTMDGKRIVITCQTCRGSGSAIQPLPRYRGCEVVDVLLNKE